MSKQPPARTPNPPRYLLLGEVLRPHGVRGELRVRILTDFPDRIGDLDTVYLASSPDDPNVTAYEVEGIRFHQDYGLLKLKTIDDRDAAELMRQLLVMVDIENAVPLEEGEFYLYQLIGMRVETQAGEALGTISEVLETGANDVYIVQSPRYGEILIPVLEHVVVKTDIDAGLIIVVLPEGLLPE